jgi:hypothetical protein
MLVIMRDVKLQNIIGATPIAVYDTEQKKCVLVFRTVKSASVYLDVPKSTVLTHAQKKIKTATNFFAKELAFRCASDTQKELLKGKDYVCLDESFNREEMVLKLK